MVGAVPLDGKMLKEVPRSLGDVDAEKLDEDVWRLRLPLPSLSPRSVNAFLLDTQDGLTLVDCGKIAGLGWQGLEHALDLAGVRPQEVTTLLCTHLHPDHAEMASTFVERTGARLLRGTGPDAVGDLLHDRRVPSSDRRAIATRAGVPGLDLPLMVDRTLTDNGQLPACEADSEITRGYVLRAGRGCWEPISAKGHSANQLVLYERRRRWLIGADLAYPTSRPFIEWGNTPDPLGEHLDSLERVAALPLELLIPGHGRPDPAPLQRLHASRARCLDWVRFALARLVVGPANAYEIVVGVLGDDPNPDVRQTGLSSVLAALDHLRLAGRVEAKDGGDTVRWSLTDA
jgi:glyoxylase-like metal-dependent hydrolase (beta-lactamase superfamily II)